MVELLDSLIQISNLTTQSSLISRASPSAVLSNSKLVPLLSSSEETTLVESVTFLPLKSIQVPSISSISRTPRETLSPPDSLTFSLLVTVRPTLCPFQREMVSDLPLSKRETPEEEMKVIPRRRMMRMTSDLRRQSGNLQIMSLSDEKIINFFLASIL